MTMGSTKRIAARTPRACDATARRSSGAAGVEGERTPRPGASRACSWPTTPPSPTASASPTPADFDPCRVFRRRSSGSGRRGGSAVHLVRNPGPAGRGRGYGGPVSLAASPGAVRDVLHRWEQADERGRRRVAAVAPVAALAAAARHDPDPWVRRQCLVFLDHHANDASALVFLAALDDPVAPVREMALHGLACERCRAEALCVADVVPTLTRVLATDPSPDVRHKVLPVLLRLADRSSEALDAIGRAADEDPDALVQEAARRVLADGHTPSRERLRRHATSRRGKDHQRRCPT
jgi:HEAT repeats